MSTEPTSPSGLVAVRKEPNRNMTKMRYQFDKPPTREAMIEEFGADPERLVRAEESIRCCAVKADDFVHSKEHYTASEVAHVLMACGIAEAFALYCVRLGGIRGQMEILPSWLGAPVSGLFRISATFEASGALKEMSGTLDEGEPFGFGIDGLQVIARSDFESIEWQEERRAEILRYEEERSARRTYPWPDLITVIRYPLSGTQAYRKFMAERWYDPDIPNSERLECSLDRACFDRFMANADSVSERFEKALSACAEPQS